MKRLLLLMLFVSAGLHAEEKSWPWTGPQGSSAVNILLLGDINIQQRAAPAEVFQHVVATLNNADVVYGNLEGLLVKSEGPDKDLPDKNGWQHIGPEVVRALKAGHIKVVGVANNVAYGPTNIMKSLAVLDSNGIAHTGAGANIEAAHAPAIVQSKGIKIGFLQYTAKWYAQDQQIATASRPGVARIMSRDGVTIDESDLNRLRNDVGRLRPLVEVLVVSIHNRDGMGRTLAPELAADSRPPAVSTPERDRASMFAPIPLGEQFSRTEDYQKKFAREAIDAGADIVYGHGSHVLQGIEVYKGKPVLYCLGNFAMDWVRMRPNKEGMIARVVVEGNRLARISLVPVVRDDQNDVVMLDPSTGQGREMLKKVEELSVGVPLKIEGREAVIPGLR